MKVFLIILCLFGWISVSEAKDTTLVIFGATGDLSTKKLFPAVYNLTNDNLNIVGIGRRQLSQNEFQQLVFESLMRHSRQKPKDPEYIQRHISYFQMSFEVEKDYERLKSFLDNGSFLFYLATEPHYFTTIIRNLKKAGLLDEQKVIIEKPFGYDIASAEELYVNISQYLHQDQMYLIDHYLGKEGVLKLIPLRNGELDKIWNAEHIDNVQINLAEKIGIGTRGKFWENTGLLRDVVQNHVIQMLAFIAAEDASNHASRIKVLNEIAELKPEDVIRAQYKAGIVDGEVTAGYLEENDVAIDSQTETYVAARLFINNERWKGVPFYIRAGKRLSRQATEIVITFKEKDPLYIRIQPDSRPKESVREAYETLIQSAINGDHSQFVDIQEIFASWRLFTPILEAWEHASLPLDHYEGGSFGPMSADELLQKDGRKWQQF